MAAEPTFIESGASPGEVSLRARGWTRLPGAAFLSVWLCFWVVGETFALGLLGVGAWALLTGRALGEDRAPLEAAPALAVGVFLLVWLTFWTIGGIAAMRELARLLWGHDRLTVGPDGLEVRHSAGPFRSRVRIARADLRAVRLSARGTEALVALTSRSTVELSRLGTRAEREAAAGHLRRVLALDTVAESASARLPEGWEEAPTPEGVPALMPERGRRTKQARVAWVVAALLGAVALVAIEAATRRPAMWGLAALLAAAAAGVVWGALWLSRGRDEWRLGSGQMVLQRRFGERVSERFVARRLELDSSRDSDGDTWYELVGVAAEADAGAEASAPADWRTATARAKHRRRILATMNDEVPPRRLGEWLAQRTGMPLEDRTTPAAREADLARLREGLRASGTLGRFVDRILERADRTRRPGG